MEDTQIIDLYFARDERAIEETDAKYGRFCLTLAKNILTLPSDAEECVNDTYLHAWNAMPPERPRLLKGWLGRVVRNLSLDRWRHAHAAKRYAGMDVLLSELDDCVPDHNADPALARRQPCSRRSSADGCARCPRRSGICFCCVIGTALRRRSWQRGTARAQSRSQSGSITCGRS